MHILSNISRKKRNQKMKLGQLIEQNMRNVFLEKAYTKYGGESTCRPFSKKIEHTSASTVWTFIQLSLFAYPS